MNYHDLISGNDRRLGTVLVRHGLRGLSLIYALVMRGRNLGYDMGWLHRYKVDIPVICAGNMTAGGTGKTPLVVWLCRKLGEKGKKAAILTRGYKGKGGGSDEVALLEEILPGVAVIVDPDRVRGANQALNSPTFRPDVLVMDDGFQHRRLRRDLDIVMIDCTNPFGFGHVLPAGLLREPLAGLRRAGAVVLSRCDLVSGETREAIRQKIQGITGADIPLAACRHEWAGLYNIEGSRIGPTELRGKTVALFCGIGNPAAFRQSLQNTGAHIAAERFYPDHVAYTQQTLKELERLKSASGADCLVTTEKDWVKLRQLSGINELKDLYWVRIQMIFTDGEEELGKLIDTLV